jgi:hypothetical protein
MIINSFSIANVFAEMLIRMGVGGERRRRQVGAAFLNREASLVVYGACVHSSTFFLHNTCTMNENPITRGKRQ